MIWFGSAPAASSSAESNRAGGSETARMERALRSVAADSPQLRGSDLADALAATGWVDRETASRLLPCYRNFDADRFFAEHLRRMSFQGAGVAPEFRAGIRRALLDMVGAAEPGQVGDEPCVRFRDGEREGVVLAYPTVAFTLGGAARDAVNAATGEMPDALVIVARNFAPGTADQLRGMLHGTEVPGTLLSVNHLLGMRAVSLRYQPGAARVVDLLGVGRPLGSGDVARLGNRV
jgi:hypothetical protein